MAYTQVQIQNYNLDPPPDNGLKIEQNNISFNADVKEPLTDPLKAAIESINNNVASEFSNQDARITTAQNTADNAQEFASGTRMVFYSAAPVGWVIVPVPTWSMLMAGSSSGGFTGGQHDPHNHFHNTGDFALQEQHNGPHTHTYIRKSVTGGTSTGGDPDNITNATYDTGSSGSGTPHNHGETSQANLRFATVTICQKS